ncbi:MAG: hypothetical protein R3B84_13480 [Zavarzinella sp.]
MSWDPGLANNNADLFDSARAEVILPSGVTNDTFPAHLISGLPGFGIWNLFGSHDAKFERYSDPSRAEDNTRVVGGSFGPGSLPLDSDPLFGHALTLNGKLVDLDPRAVWNSQIYFDRFSLGDSSLGLSATRTHTMHSRWINFSRNIGGLPSAGGAGVVWQTTFPKGTFELHGTDQSPLLAKIKEVMEEQDDIAGLMLRFATYRTLYFQNGILNSIPHQPRTVAELAAMHQQGHYFSNPAYSRVVGTIGLWQHDEAATWPGGRYLTPSNPIPGVGVPCGPAVFEISDTHLVIDFLHVIPEVNADLEKLDLGPLIVSVQAAGTAVDIGQINLSDYGQVAYESRGGIVELAVALDLANLVRSGELVISSTIDGERVELLREQRYTAVVDRRDVYLNQNETHSVTVRVLDHGRPPSVSTNVVVGSYRVGPGGGVARTSDPETVHSVDADGNMTITVQHSELGPLDYRMQPYEASSLVPSLPPQLDIMSDQFFSTRTLPTDMDLNDNASDSELTWEFIYNTVLRHWDLISPVMTQRGLPLNDQALMEALAATIVEVTSKDPAMFESARYMPITRDLSDGKRELLRRWARLH